MTFRYLKRALAGLALIALFPNAPLSAQGSPCTDPTLQLEVGHSVWDGEQETIVWDCTPGSLESGRLRTTAPEGTWVFLLPYLEVHTDDPELQQRLADFLLAFPWLARYVAPATELSPNDPSLIGQPDLRVDATKVRNYLERCMVPAYPQYPLPSEQVRLWAQPTLDLDSQSTIESTVWSTQPDNQLAWQLAGDWKEALVDPQADDPTWLGWWPMMQRTALWQAPTAQEAQALLDDPGWMKEAIDLGLTMRVQAFGMIDPDTTLDHGSDPNLTPGLPSLDHLPATDPDLFVSSAIPIPIQPALPLSGDPPSDTLPGGPYNRAPGEVMEVTLSWFVPVTNIHFPAPGGTTISRRLFYSAPGVVFVTVPNGVVDGPLHFSSPYGTTVGVVTDPPLYVNPAVTVTNGPGGAGGPGGGGR